MSQTRTPGRRADRRAGGRPLHRDPELRPFRGVALGVLLGGLGWLLVVVVIRFLG